MTIICAWCQQTLGTKEPLADTRVTHGICPPCKRAWLGKPLQATRQAMKDTARRIE